MKTLSIINLHNAEIRKNQLAKIKGGVDVKCYCTTSNPFVITKQQGSTTKICNCDSNPANSVGVFNSIPD